MNGLMNLVLAHVTQGGYSVIVSVTCCETLKKKLAVFHCYTFINWRHCKVTLNDCNAVFPLKYL